MADLNNGWSSVLFRDRGPFLPAVQDAYSFNSVVVGDIPGLSEKSPIDLDVAFCGLFSKSVQCLMDLGL